MTSFEWVAVAYFAAIAAAAPWAPRRARGLLYAGGAIALVIVARFALPWSARAWLPHAYLVLGYWIPAAFTGGAWNERFERWLARADASLNVQLPMPNVRRPTSGPRSWPRRGATGASFGRWRLGVGGWTELLELAYLLCYLLVPTAFSAVFAYGTPADIERFWLAVLVSGYLCYGTLPWTAARPPRLVAACLERRGLARVNAEVLGRVSHQLVTFPSGHAAVSLASALSVARVSPALAVGFGGVAVAIAVAAVAGRYHYLVDVLLGVLVGALASVLTGSVA